MDDRQSLNESVSQTTQAPIHSGEKMSRKVNEEKWQNLLLSFGVHPKFLGEIKSMYEGKFGLATEKLSEIQKFAEENGQDINVIMAQVVLREMFVDLATAAEKWGKILRTFMKSMPCQQAQYAIQDVESIRMHCDSFIKYGPKPADEEIPLEASEFQERPQLSPEEYEAQEALNKKILEGLAKFPPEEAQKRAELMRDATPEQIDIYLDPTFVVPEEHLGLKLVEPDANSAN
jgi:hypothetical protein